MSTEGGDRCYHGFAIPRVDVDRVTYPPKDESWKAYGNCAGLPEAWFFPERGDDTRNAKAVCAGCVVRVQCLEYALTPPIEAWGIWGGASERERRPMRLARRTA